MMRETPDRSHTHGRTQHLTMQPSASASCSPSVRSNPAIFCDPACRDDDAETPDRSHKPIPEWARSQVLFEALKQQQATDPDSIFGARQTTCDLGDMFAGADL